MRHCRGGVSSGSFSRRAQACGEVHPRAHPSDAATRPPEPSGASWGWGRLRPRRALPRPPRPAPATATPPRPYPGDQRGEAPREAPHRSRRASAQLGEARTRASSADWRRAGVGHVDRAGLRADSAPRRRRGGHQERDTRARAHPPDRSTGTTSISRPGRGSPLAAAQGLGKLPSTPLVRRAAADERVGAAPRACGAADQPRERPRRPAPAGGQGVRAGHTSPRLPSAASSSPSSRGRLPSVLRVGAGRRTAPRSGADAESPAATGRHS